MQPTDRKIDQPWLQGGGVQQVMQALAAGDGCARFVGGCVRDALFGRAVRDINIPTNLKPKTIISLLINTNLKYTPTKLNHNTITTITDNQKFKVTTLHHNMKTNNHHTIMTFTNN